MRCDSIGLELLPARYATLAEFIAACGCSMRKGFPTFHDRVGRAPASAQLLDGGVIVFSADVAGIGHRWTPGHIMAHAAHEAAHHVAGPWSIECELPMLPWELSVLLSVADASDRAAGWSYMLGTALGDYGLDEDGALDADDVRELVARGGWQHSRIWRELVDECLANGLPLDGSIPGKLSHRRPLRPLAYR